MSQIVKKKKGRPSKADLAARAAAQSNNGHRNHRRRDTAEEEQRKARRSLRRRGTVRYNLIDYDEDYLDDDEDFEFEEDDIEAEDGVMRREKKLKFVLKLSNAADRGRVRSNGGGNSAVRSPGSESEGEEEEDDRVVKKRKIMGDEYEDEDDEVDHDSGDSDDGQGRGGKGESHKADFFHGTSDVPFETQMPEKKQLELMLDKLQKKDTYNVFAEPVDPEELPDYHDIIKHPMDFATLRKKLADGFYSNFEQFKSDVYLICSNAMQYNAPDTIYHKQACAIKELAEKKFLRVKLGVERTRIENGQTEEGANPDQKTKPNPIIKIQMKKPLGRSTQDPVRSDFCSGATVATVDVHNISTVVQADNYERLRNNEGLAEGISSLADYNVEKVEDLQSGKGMTPKFFGRKPLVVDENRRATYEISNQPVDESESIYATFEGEYKQFIPVGLDEEHSYAQSLARFAATLGPVSWKIASKRIERALPQGSKFGRGWVMDYEPIPTPVLFVAGQSLKEYPSARKPQCAAVAVKAGKPGETLVRASEQLGDGGPSSNGRPCLFPYPERSEPTTPSGRVVQQQNPFVKKLQNAVNPVKSDKPSVNPSPGDVWGQRMHVSDAKPPHVPSFGGSRPATPAGAAIQQENPFVRRLQYVSVPVKNNESPESIVTTSGRLDSGSISEGTPSIFGASRGSRPTTGPVIQPQTFPRYSLRPEDTCTSRMEENGPTLNNQKTNHFLQKQFQGIAETVTNRMDENGPILNNQKTNLFLQKQFQGSAETSTSWQVDTIARNKNFLQSVPLRPPSSASERGVVGRFPIGNVNGSVDINQMASLPSSGVSTQVIGTKTSFRPRLEQGLGDPVQVMRVSAENAQKQQSSMNNWHASFQVRPSIQSLRGDNTGAATDAASVWMHASAVDINRPSTGNPSSHSYQIPADSVYNRTRELYPQISQSGEYPVSGSRLLPPERSKVTFEEFVLNPAKVSNEAQVHNRPMVFPQLMVTDQSRIPLQPPRQGHNPHGEQKRKRDTLPPDLNIAFQSTVDPQQPDLALQL